jgi:hypothetical protein
MEPKVLEGPPDESGIPRESPVKLLLEACNTYRDITALVRKSFGQLVWRWHHSLDRHKIRYITDSRSVVPTGEKSGGQSSTFGGQKRQYRWSRVTLVVILSNCSISDELRNMFALSKPTVVFCTDKSQKNVLKVVNEFTFVKTIISFDDAVDQENEILQYSDLIKNSVSFQVEEDVDLEDQVALILNSSGTTGLPKGVMFTYKMLRTNLVHARSGSVLEIGRNLI